MRTLRVLLLLLLWLPTLAHAALVQVCIDWKPVYDDATASVGDDYLNTLALTVDAYGVHVTVADATTTVFSGYASDVTGCTAQFSAVVGPIYTVTAKSEAVVHGNTVLYKTPAGGRYLTTWSGVQFPGGGAHTLSSGNTPMARVMAVLGYALKNQDLGVTGQTISVWRKEGFFDGPACPTNSCNDDQAPHDIYLLIDTVTPWDHSKFKSVIAHELGHKMLELRGGTFCSVVDETAVGTGNCPGGAGHFRDSIEWHSLAALEGYAQFYASAVFNEIGGVGCGSYSKSPVDWDHNGATNGSPYACDAAPVTGVGLSASDYMADECGPVFTAGTATEYDYQRFYWDLVDKESLTAGDIADVIGAACENPPWNATYQSAWPLILDNPKNRMLFEAASLGAAWDNQDDTNGVTR